MALLQARVSEKYISERKRNRIHEQRNPYPRRSREVRAFQVTFSTKWIFFLRVFSSFLYFVQARVLKRLWISYVYVLIRALNRLIHELWLEISNFWIYNNIRWERIFLYYFLYVESIGQVSSIVANCVLEKVKDLISPILISKILKIDKRETGVGEICGYAKLCKFSWNPVWYGHNKGRKIKDNFFWKHEILREKELKRDKKKKKKYRHISM